MESKQPAKPSKIVTEARAAAQRAKLDAQAQEHRLAPEVTTTSRRTKEQQEGRLPDGAPGRQLNAPLKTSWAIKREAIIV